MSTKTTFKRVALVAVAALGFGMLSVVPSQATQLVSVSLASAPSTGTTGNEVRSIASLNGLCDITGQYGATNYMAVWTAIPAASRIGVPTFGALTGAETTSYSSATTNYEPGSSGLAFSGQYQNVGYYWDAGGNQKFVRANNAYVLCNSTGRYAQLAAVAFTPDVPGTYTMMMFDPSNASTQVFWSVTVADRAAITAFGSSTSTTVSTAVGAAVGNGVGDSTAGFSAPKTATLVSIHDIVVTQRNGGLTASTLMTTFNKLTATISGPGLVKWSTESTPSRSSTMGTAAQTSTLNVYADGTAGVATITFTSGTTVLGTKKITFYSTTVAKITTVVNHAIIVSGANSADIDGYGAVTATVVDADGFPIANKTVVASSDNTASVALTTSTATTDAYGEATFLVTGGAVAGSANITVATGTDKTAIGFVAAAPVSVRRGSTTVAKYEMSLDKSSYLPGEIATLTILLKDSSGLPVADGSVMTTSSVTATYALAAGALPTTSVTAAAGDKGMYSVKVNMPINSGVQTITLKLPSTSLVTGNASVTATVTLDAAAQAASDTAQAAVDAAAEATDAANAATDAANAAAEAADAATAAAQDAADAVAALSAQVATLISGLKAQLTALTNLVIKIQKKVKA